MTRHLIDELVFELAIDSGNRALRDDACLSRLVTGTMLPVVEQVLDEFDDGDTVLVLPSLELDLGAIGQADYENTAPQRLRAVLGDALRRALGSARQARTAGSPGDGAEGGDLAATIVSRQDAELDQLARFLDTGTMPWHADLGLARLHEALLERLLAGGGVSLWNVLGRALAAPHSARRLVEQFPQHQLLAVLRGAAGARAEQFEASLAEVLPSADPQLAAAAWIQVLAAATGNARLDAQADCAHILAGPAPASPGAAGPSHSDIDVMAQFLDNGVLHLEPDSVRASAAREALLDRLLARGGAPLRELLSRALANPRRARRLVDQFPERQLLALLRVVAGAHARQFEDVLAEASRNLAGADNARIPAAAWIAVLSACSLHHGDDAAAACVRIRAALAPSGVEAPRQPSPDDQLLAAFLDSGVLPLAIDGLNQPLHEALLGRLLMNGGDHAWSVLAKALADPRGARRFVEQFPEPQRRAVLRGMARAGAEQFEALLDEAGQWPSIGGEAVLTAVWLQVLAACTGGVQTDAKAHCARIRATLAPSGDDAGASLSAGADLLASFLDSGRLPPGFAIGATGSASHGHPAPTLAAASPGATAGRAIGQGRAAATGKRAGAPRSTIWRRAGSDTGHPARVQASSDVAAMPAPSLRPGMPAVPGLHLRLLAGARLAAAPDRAAKTPPAHEALLDRLLAQGGEAVWGTLARALANPAAARRLAEFFPERQVHVLMQRLTPAQATQLRSLLAEIDGDPPRTDVAIAGAAERRSDRAQPTDHEHRRLDATTAPTGGHSYRAQIRHFARFLESGLLPHAAAARDDGRPAHEALLDDLIARADDDLWLVIARALERDENAGRLLAQFPQRQLVALVRKSAPGYAPSLERLLQRLAAARALRTGDEAGDDRVTHLWWRHMLAACVARPPAHALPARVWAKVALDLGGLPQSNAGIIELRRADGDAAALPWRPSQDARGTGHARVPLAGPPKRHVHAVMQRVAAAHALGGTSLPSEIGSNSATRTDMEIANAADVRTDGAQRADNEHPPLDPAAGQPGTRSYRAQLEDLAQFLESGLLPHAAARSDGRPPHEALLDDLIAHADDDLWGAIALALERGDSAGRLLAQFPQRQLAALIRKSAPGYAASLERLLQRLSATQAIRSGAEAGDESQTLQPGAKAGDERVTRLCYRHVLAACVARPGAQALPARVWARVVLEPGILPESDAGIVYARSMNSNAAAQPWRASGDERRAGRALVRLSGLVAPVVSALDGPFGPTAMAQLAPAEAGSAVGLVVRQREQMARWLHEACRELEAELLREAAVPEDSHSAGADRVATLRAAIATQVTANAAIAPERRQLLLDSIDAKSTEAADPAAFLRAVMAVLASGAPLDLDGLLAHAAPVADAPPTPMRLLATALKARDAAAVFEHWQTLLRRHAPQLRDALRHFGRSLAVRRALAQALPNAIFTDLAGLLDAGAPAILRTLLTPSAPLQAAMGDGAAWNEWAARCRLQALTSLTGGAAPASSIEASAFLRTLAPADSARNAALLEALPAQFRAGSVTAPATQDSVATAPATQGSVATAPATQGSVAMAPATQGSVATARATQDSVATTPETQGYVATAPATQGSAAPAPQVHGASRLLGQPRAVDRVLAASAQDLAAPPGPTELLVVANAGMVLAAPYLPRLFSALGLTVDGAFIDETAAGRAVHLVQYMVTGQSHSPEYQLVLNKILCGVATAAPVPAGIDITQKEVDTIEGMIQAMVTHAKVLGSCSVAAMRQTFFARKADLQLIDDAWQLRVHPGTFDMLLDRLPWTYSIVKFGWMARPVHVEWRPT